MQIARTITRTIIVGAMITAGLPGRAATSDPAMTLAVATAEKAVCRPTLKVDAVSYEAGTAFLVAGSQSLLLTAQHLFGPDGGLATAVAWQDMPTHAHIASCRPIGAGASLSGETAIAIPSAHPMDAADQSGAIYDVAVFRTSPPGDASPGLTLAVSPPKEGDRVWLVAKAQGSTSLLHSAHVLGSKNGALLFAYDDPKLDLQATSGAPIVDTDGKVVGLNLGGDYDNGAKTVIGVADDLAVLTTAVATAGR
ncbi:serine protease [Sphingomonas koreensis]|nr:serine protease [Sphingomonas koreensis]